MPVLTIPTKFRPGLEFLLSLDDSHLSRLLEVLNGLSGEIWPAEVVDEITRALPELDVSQARDAVSTLYSLYTLQANLGNTPREMAGKIIDAAQRIAGLRKRLGAQDAEQPAAKLACLLSVPRLVQNAKADNWVKRREGTYELDADVAEIFRDLAAQWQRETAFLSIVRDRITHPAYLQIIGLGRLALPLLLTELRENPDHWFMALYSIAREDPASGSTSFEETTAKWLSWGRERGLMA